MGYEQVFDVVPPLKLCRRGPSSAALPARLAAFAGGFHAFTGVVGLRPDASHRLAHPDRVDPGQVLPAVRHLLDRPDGERRPLAQPPASAPGLVEQFGAGTTRQARPISFALAASMRSPVSRSSSAGCMPIRWGSRIAPTMVGTPSRTSGMPNSASSAAITKSHALTRVSP